MPGDPGLQLELASALVDVGDVDGARSAAVTAKQLAAQSGGVHDWTTADEVFTTALQLTANPTSLAERDGWPDLVRGTANSIAGHELRAAEELRDWFDEKPADADYVHFVTAARASLAAARVADDDETAARWQLEAARFLRATVAACAEQANMSGAGKGALTALRWLQADPVVNRGPWHGEAAAEFEDLQQSMRALATQLLGN